MASSYKHHAAPVTLERTEGELPRSEATSLDAPQRLTLAELAQVSGGDDAVVTLPVNGW